MTRRSGDELQAATRLTQHVERPDVRAILLRCLVGEVAPATALSQLFQLIGSASAVRDVVDVVTQQAAAESRAGDMLLQDRVDELTQVLLDPDLAVPPGGALRGGDRRGVDGTSES